MTPPGKRIQLLFNAQGNERGPGTVAHAWATAVQDDVNASELRFEWKRKSKSSKHTSRLTGAAHESFFAEWRIIYIWFIWSTNICFAVPVKVGVAATAFAIAAESLCPVFRIKHGSSASKMTRQMLQSQLMAML
jgi:hypothetical protein